MTEEQTTPQVIIGPARISFPMLLLKVISGIFGGGVGALIFIFIFVIGSSILAPLTNTESTAEYVSPIFIFLLIVMVFLSSTIGNILSTLFLALTEREKYSKVASCIYQIFIVSIIIFILMVPVYFIAVSADMKLATLTIALHIIISAVVSSLILEVVSNTKYSLLGVYGVTFSMILSSSVLFGLYYYLESTQLLLFLVLPIVWGCYALVYSIVNMLYGWIIDIYDKDFLSIYERYGDDYGQKIVEKIVHKAKDEAGSDFLRHN